MQVTAAANNTTERVPVTKNQQQQQHYSFNQSSEAVRLDVGNLPESEARRHRPTNAEGNLDEEVSKKQTTKNPKKYEIIYYRSQSSSVFGTSIFVGKRKPDSGLHISFSLKFLFPFKMLVRSFRHSSSSTTSESEWERKRRKKTQKNERKWKKRKEKYYEEIVLAIERAKAQVDVCPWQWKCYVCKCRFHDRLLAGCLYIFFFFHIYYLFIFVGARNVFWKAHSVQFGSCWYLFWNLCARCFWQCVKDDYSTRTN